MKKISFLILVLFMVFSVGIQAEECTESSGAIVLAVLDPLAIDLACDCIEGFAQRNYRDLSGFLKRRIDRPVELVFAGSVNAAIQKSARKRVDLVIGKDSVVCYGFKEKKLTGKRIAYLTDKNGNTTFTGLIVVGKEDPAKTVTDLKEHRIVFGPADCDEKHAAALRLLEKEGISVPEKPETVGTCTIAALEIVDNESQTPVAAAVSDYALALIEGCKTIEKGALRILARTEPVPFVGVFVTDSVDSKTLTEIVNTLKEFGQDEARLKRMESKTGFEFITPILVPEPVQGPNSEKKKINATETWPQWRGPNSRANQADLPLQLAETPEILWEKKLDGDGISGIVSDGRVVIVADRDALDTSDIFHCLDFESGLELWQVKYPAPSNFDYGNAPRATPVLAGDRVFTLGASGHLHALDLSSGKVLWKKSLSAQFTAPPPQWGFSSSPLLIDSVYGSGQLIVQPGGPSAGFVALDALSGETRWKSDPGRPAAYASPVLCTLSGVRQIVAYDEKSLGGWDPETGNRLWELFPRHKGDFNVPTPIPLDENKLYLVTENNKGRIYRFDEKGIIDPTPVAVQEELGHDSNTPVSDGTKIYSADWALLCLDAETLNILWTLEDDSFGDYATLILGDERLLVCTHSATILLIDIGSQPGKIVSRWKLFEEDDVLLSHPAVLQDRLLIRSATKIMCVRLK